MRTPQEPSLASHVVGLWPALEALRHRPSLIERVLVDPSDDAAVAALGSTCAAAGVPLVADPSAVRELRRHRGASVVTLLRREADTLDPEAPHLLLSGSAQAGNVGASLRAALGFGWEQIGLIAAHVDAWSPHLLRASQGARFALKVATFASWSDYRNHHPQKPVVALVAPQHGGVDLRSAAPPPAAAWLFGPEGGSLPESVLRGAARVSIAQDPRLESHNLAVAVGIVLYALSAVASAQPKPDQGGCRCGSP